MLHACFYTICLMFCYTSWHFYAFFETNLLTSRHSVSFLFSTIFVFQKSYTGNILGIGRNKFLKSYFFRKLPEIQRGVRGGATRAPHTRAAWPSSWPRLLCVRAPRSTLNDALSPIKIPPINFSETHRDSPPSLTRDREGPEALSGTLSERRIATGGLLHRHACLRSDEWIVYLGLWVYSSS
jgi:hypothetical protein